MKLRPIGDHLIVKALTAEETSASGIIIPDTVDKERPERGEVIAAGPGKVLENGSRSTMDVKAGDKVVFKKYAPDEVKVGKDEFLVIKSDDVMAVIE
ncbi:co-chaperone GroES [Candidatus Uhrbacteria bacterium RIFCSPHIGHO2_01_FULL_63_20]|uniref:Co-chaperonin GroES n=1 Tax=Candidatus Uhrbacteria bacterium RIFCSPHIGHO2_01_FULL_63_20 TaxID=1802385 RepID=A0A1F7TLQ7_9BACT|nr:MAG: co-chaperone GroES [Candidatus Uhrbacteria bacterium RIFCSPHIGHO2_01_FULL_63_20]